MKRFLFLLPILSLVLILTAAKKRAELRLFKADNANIKYVGRIDFANPQAPRIWAPGVYIMARFQGAKFQFLVDDEAGGNNHNYLEIMIDGKDPYRIKLTDKVNVIDVPEGLSNGDHTILICKDTESNIGYIDFLGFKCEKLLTPPALPKHKIEYFGDSITSGTGMDLSVMPCGTGQWYDQHNAFMSYGALTSRNLDAQWQLTALAGVGLVHSCCNMKVVMPQIYDKVFLIGDTIKWNFNNYKPDVVTICLGQNDGPAQDSTVFCSAYVKLINGIRQHCPQADIVCLTSPMGDQTLTNVLKRYLTAIVTVENAGGDKKVSRYFFSKQYHNGCGGHPDLADHKLIANELTAYIKQLKGW
jgi:lysophospholipase L1-like esterase